MCIFVFVALARLQLRSSNLAWVNSFFGLSIFLRSFNMPTQWEWLQHERRHRHTSNVKLARLLIQLSVAWNCQAASNCASSTLAVCINRSSGWINKCQAVKVAKKPVIVWLAESSQPLFELPGGAVLVQPLAILSWLLAVFFPHRLRYLSSRQSLRSPNNWSAVVYHFIVFFRII